jgi:hypothetical protein
LKGDVNAEAHRMRTQLGSLTAPFGEAPRERRVEHEDVATIYAGGGKDAETVVDVRLVSRPDGENREFLIRVSHPRLL